MKFNEWLEVYGDDYILSIPYEYQYDMYLDYIGGL